MSSTRRYFEPILLIFAISVLINYPWELAQAPLYTWPGEPRNPWWHCFVASLGDGFLTLLIYTAGWVLVHDPHWVQRPGVAGYALMLTGGFVIAVAVEWDAVHVLHRWDYLPRMPLLPLLRIGVVPVAQMLVLPPLIFWIVTAIGRRRRK